MCQDCAWDKAVDEIDSRLVNSHYAPYAAELLTLQRGLVEREHVGDAIHYRLEDMREAMTDDAK